MESSHRKHAQSQEAYTVHSKCAHRRDANQLNMSRASTGTVQESESIPDRFRGTRHESGFIANLTTGLRQSHSSKHLSAQAQYKHAVESIYCHRHSPYTQFAPSVFTGAINKFRLAADVCACAIQVNMSPQICAQAQEQQDTQTHDNLCVSGMQTSRRSHQISPQTQCL